MSGVLLDLFSRKKSKESGGKLVMGTEFVTDNLGRSVVVECKHEIFQVYLYEEQTDLWICSNCECENVSTATKCKLCNQKR